MADKGIVNNRKGPITFSVKIDGKSQDLVLRPGANRLSEAQHAALRDNPVFRALFRSVDAEERVSVPDPENPGEMKESVIKKRIAPKLREEPLESLDTDAKDHTGDEKPAEKPASSGKGK